VFFSYVIAVWRSFIIGILVFGPNMSAHDDRIYGTFILNSGLTAFLRPLTDLGLRLFARQERLHQGRGGRESRDMANCTGLS
jgi:hypothetical protein